MSDKKIRDLPAASSVNTTDIFEKTNDPGGVPVSQKATGQQFLDFIGAQAPLTLTSVSVGAGKILLNADGSASFSTGNVLIHSDGSVGFAGNNAQFSATGDLNIGFGLATIQAADGSVSFAGGAFSVNSAGAVSIVGLNLLNNDGSASFASGGFAIDIAGSVSIASGGITLSAANGSASFAGGGILLNADGSVSFAGGTFTVDNNGNLTASPSLTTSDVLASNTVSVNAGAVLLDGTTGHVSAALYNANGNDGLTTTVTVLTALPSTFKTLTFTGGILTSVT